jgi:hypothetical protein
MPTPLRFVATNRKMISQEKVYASDSFRYNERRCD